MKKKLFVCSAIAALLLVGCSSGTKAGELPSGGKTVDVSSEEGQATMRSAVSKFATAYTDNEVKALGAKLEVKNVNASIDSHGDVNEFKLEVKKLGGVLEAKLGENQLEAHLSKLGGELDINGNFYLDEEGEPIEFDDGVKMSNVALDAYILNDNLYADYSSKGVRNLLNSASGIASKVIGNLAGIDVDVDLNDLVDNVTEASGRQIALEGIGFEFSPSSIFSSISIEVPSDDEAWANIFEVLNGSEMFEFRSYSDGRFGIKVSATKDALIDFAVSLGEEEADVKSSFENIDKLDVNLAVVLNADGMLSSVSLKEDVELAINDEFEIGVSGEEALTLTYNDDVKFAFPSEADLEKYVALDTSKLSTNLLTYLASLVGEGE